MEKNISGDVIAKAMGEASKAMESISFPSDWLAPLTEDAKKMDEIVELKDSFDKQIDELIGIPKSLMGNHQ